MLICNKLSEIFQVNNVLPTAVYSLFWLVKWVSNDTAKQYELLSHPTKKAGRDDSNSLIPLFGIEYT